MSTQRLTTATVQAYRSFSGGGRGISRRLFSTGFKSSAQVELFINGTAVKIEQGSSIIQACEKVGVDIPRFCYHERLSVAGNCRMCLVELEKSPKPVASCAMPVMPGMKIKTDTPLVKKAREGVMEFLLANHPLDCPICDQGGECDLQDQSVRYGSDRSRFHEAVGKRAVEDKYLGPLVKTSMTRCIHCTRCIRFANEVAGAVELGSSGRGNDMQIGTYIEKTIESEMSGNIVDLCPVGALISRPYTFQARPWELRKTESVDVLDAVGSNIRIDTRGVEVMRILPRLNDDINAEWIADKTRFAYDGLKRQRLTTPLLKNPATNEFETVTWAEALKVIASQVQKSKPEEMMGIAGALADVESMVALKDLFNRLGSENLQVDTISSNLPTQISDFRVNYTMGASINGVEECDCLLIVGGNPRHEAAIINSRIRTSYLNNNLDIGFIGELPKLNYEVTYLGDSISSLESSTNESAFLKQLHAASKPMILVGSGVYERADASHTLKVVADLAKKIQKNNDWKVLNFMQRNASVAGAFEIGFISPSSAQRSDAKFVYLLNADEIKTGQLPESSFVVYQGHHGDAGAQFADVILPGAAYTEKSATYVNTEGRAQNTRAAVAPIEGAREDWKILRALGEMCGVNLPYDDIYELNYRMFELSPHLVNANEHNSSALADVALDAISMQAHSSSLSSSKEALSMPIKDYYMTDPISRASVTMSKCSLAFSN